jgi:tetratricopeptide (TPR) repeat protein
VPSTPEAQALEQVYQDGRTAFKAGRYEDAAAHFARVIAADPEHLRARLNWAAAMSHIGKTSEAMVQCYNVVARDPTNAEAYYQWGAILVRMGRHQEAVEKFDQALALKPMVELLQDDPALQYTLQGYLQRQRRQESDTGVTVSRPKPATQP